MSYKITCAPQIVLASKFYLQLFCGYAAPTPFPSPAGQPFNAICPKFQTVEGTPPAELLSDLDGDGLPAFVEEALGTHPLQVDDRIPGTTINAGLKLHTLQVSEPAAGSGISHVIQIGDGLNNWREAALNSDYIWGDLGNGQTSVELNGVTYRVAVNQHPMSEHSNAFLRLLFTVEG